MHALLCNKHAFGYVHKARAILIGRYYRVSIRRPYVRERASAKQKKSVRWKHLEAHGGGSSYIVHRLYCCQPMSVNKRATIARAVSYHYVLLHYSIMTSNKLIAVAFPRSLDSAWALLRLLTDMFNNVCWRPRPLCYWECLRKISYLICV